MAGTYEVQDGLTKEPRGSKYPIFKDSGPKHHTLKGFWDQSPYILSIWNFRGTYLELNMDFYYALRYIP